MRGHCEKSKREVGRNPESEQASISTRMLPQDDEQQDLLQRGEIHETMFLEENLHL